MCETVYNNFIYNCIKNFKPSNGYQVVTKTSGLRKTFNDIRKCSLYYFEQKKRKYKIVYNQYF